MIWINTCGAIVSFAFGYFLVRCLIKATCCEPVRIFFRVFATMMRALWAVISFVVWGLYVSIRAIIRRFQQVQRVDTPGTTNSESGPRIEELPDVVVQRPGRLEVLPPTPLAIFPPAPPTPALQTRPVKRVPPLPERKPIIKPSGEARVTFRSERGTIGGGSAAIQMEPLYDESAYYDAIITAEGARISRQGLINSVNERLNRLIGRERLPSPPEVEMEDLPTSPLL